MAASEDVIPDLVPVNDVFSYETRTKLGGGNFGTVYKGVNRRSNEFVAIKNIQLSKRSETDKVKQELACMRMIGKHENIVQLLGEEFMDEQCWVFLEYCELGNLTSYLKCNVHIQIGQKLDIMYQSAVGVAFMHGREPPVIHRDIKPDNILLTSQKGHLVVKIGDFGLSKSAMAFGTFCGTSEYAAPEIYDRENRFFGGSMQPPVTYSTSADVFSLGVTYYVILKFGVNHVFTYPVTGNVHLTL